jgi:hypothetical protein
VPPLAASLVLLCAAVGSVVLAGFAALAVIPVVFTLAGLGWVAALLLLGWAGIEALAALERWFENDPRFHR